MEEFVLSEPGIVDYAIPKTFPLDLEKHKYHIKDARGNIKFAFTSLYSACFKLSWLQSSLFEFKNDPYYKGRSEWHIDCNKDVTTVKMAMMMINSWR